MTLDTLRKARFTAGLPEHQLAKLAALARDVRFEDDQLIVPAGERSTRFYLVLSGSVCVEFRTPIYIVLIQVLQPGEAFGWSSFLDHHNTLFQVRAREASTGLCWDSSRLSAACREDRDFGLELFHRLLGLVAERLEATESRLAEFMGAVILSGNSSQPEDNKMAEEIFAVDEIPEIDPGEKKTRGRPQGIDDGSLLSARNFLVWLLESTWGEVGWNLRRVKTAGDVRPALQVWEHYPNTPYVVEALLRPSGHSANAKKLSAMGRRRIGLSQFLSEALEHQQRCRVSLEKADRELTPQLPQDQRDLVTEQRAKRATAFERAEAEYLSLQNQLKDLVESIKDGHAYFARAELVRFCRNGRYAMNPLNTANALAGLPFIGYRQSVKRCRQWKCDNAGGLPYQVFKVLCQIVDSRRRDTKLSQHAEQWLRLRRASESNAIEELQRNWHYLLRSIITVVRAKPIPRAVPYRITTEYFRRTGRLRPEIVAFDRHYFTGRAALRRGKRERDSTAGERRMDGMQLAPI